MERYINSINGVKLPSFGKVPFLQENAKGQLLAEAPRTWQKDLVAVVENAAFDAAVYVRDQDDLLYYSDSGGRPLHWLVVPGAETLVGPYEKD